MSKEHVYQTTIAWIGNTGQGTKEYASYERSYIITVEGKAAIQGSSDPSFRGDPAKHNPEELFLASISGCHMLWYLHLCAVNNVTVHEYSDKAVGTMHETDLNGGHFTEVVLYPEVLITDSSKIIIANALHHEANKLCFIANSLNFNILHMPVCKARG